MGGRAFTKRTGVEARRFDVADLHKFEQLFSQGLSGYADLKVVPYYRKKEDFGDLDTLVNLKPGCTRKEVVRAARLLPIVAPNYIYNNGTCTSFLTLDGAQIDLIFPQEGCYKSSLDYYSWNDLGNLMGRIANRLGFKYGHAGLNISVRDGTNEIGWIELSKDTKEIYEFFGWDYDTWAKGFDTVEDLFDFVIVQKHFRASDYLIDNLDHANRTRNRKRGTYMSFLAYLEAKGLLPCEEQPNEERRAIRAEFRTSALAHFGKTEEHAEIWKGNDERKIIKAKFNGGIVSELTGLTDKPLGEFMARFRVAYPHGWMLSSTPEEIKQKVKDFYAIRELVDSPLAPHNTPNHKEEK